MEERGDGGSGGHVLSEAVKKSWGRENGKKVRRLGVGGSALGRDVELDSSKGNPRKINL